MPIIKSAIKRAKQEQVRRARNSATKQVMRRTTRSLEAAIAAKDAKKASTTLNEVYKVLDTAAKKNVIHANKAARKKASYAKAVKEIGGSSAPAAKAKKAPAKKTTAKKAPAKKAAAKKTTAKKPAAKKAAPKKK